MAINITQSDYLSQTIGLSRENLSLGYPKSYNVRPKPDCSATEISYNLESSHVASSAGILSRKRITKTLIRLRGCAGWSVPLFFGQQYQVYLKLVSIFLEILLIHVIHVL